LPDDLLGSILLSLCVTPAAGVQSALTPLGVRVPLFRVVARRRAHICIDLRFAIFAMRFHENRLDSSIAKEKIDC
jgi:hypothetical protein